MNVSIIPNLQNHVKALRLARGWSQDELARRSGLSRSGISAIEVQRLVPSAAAAILLAKALGTTVEDLFSLESSPAPHWAWPPTTSPARYWQARVGTDYLLYPHDGLAATIVPHDGIALPGSLPPIDHDLAESTLVMACCDPAVGLLAAELAQSHAIRLLIVRASSRRALELVGQRKVHVAGVHLSTTSGEGNADVVRAQLGGGYQLLRAARWQEGLATDPARQVRSIRGALRSRLRWVGREPGSGARQCLDELLGDRKPPRHEAHSHQGVAEAIRSGYADVGICVELVSAEAGFRFLPIREEAYDLCFSDHVAHDPRIQQLIAVIQSRRYRKLLGELPGYGTADAGQLQSIR